jgi:peptide/nickel transport system substrate-binding protein
MGGFNLVGYKNQKVDELIKKAEKITDDEEFGRAYREIFALIAVDNPYLFLYIPKQLTAVDRRVDGVRPSIIGITHNLYQWSKRKSLSKVMIK